MLVNKSPRRWAGWVGVRDCLGRLALGRAEGRVWNMGRLEDRALTPRGRVVVEQDRLRLVLRVAPDEGRFGGTVDHGPPRVHGDHAGADEREGMALCGHVWESEKSSHANRLADSSDAVK